VVLLNYAGKFDANLPIDGTGAHSHGHLHVESVSAHALHAPAGAIIVPDAQLLFNGDFKRSGVDLVLSNDDHELVLQDYFKGEKRAALSSPDGAHLTGDIVNALTGHQQFAQADGSASVAKVIGHVSKLVGTATAIRNGVSIILNNGDNVEKGDVVQSGSGSTLGVSFIDGTVFGLSSNAKMVLNEMVYDPNGSSNSSLISLVAGTISFVAGETAKHGDMKVDTPVATMGIRGTAVLVEIDFDVPQNGVPNAKFQVLVEPDGTTGRYVLFDKVTLAPIATVDQAGVIKSLSQGILSTYSAPLSADVQKLITDVFSLKFTDNTNPNTKSFDHYTDTLLPQAFTPVKLADGATAIPIILNVNTTGNAPSSGPIGPVNPLSHIDGPPLVVATDGALLERIGVTHSSAIDTVSGKINFVDINAGDTPTVTTKFDSFTYQNAQHQDVTATLNALQLADIAKVEAKLVLAVDPGNNNNGSVTWTYTVVDSAFDFLAVGETLTLTYEARVDNNFAPNDEAGFQKFTITIARGSNDVPVITTGPQTVPFSGGTATPGGDLPASGPTSGTLSFTDVDLTDTHTVSAKLTSAVLPGKIIPPGPLAAFEAALSASIAADSTGSGSGTINWKVADLPVFLADFIPKGETLTLTYTVTVTDSQGATATQNIIVTITGTNAPALVWIATTPADSLPGGLWSDAANWETGTVPTLSDDVIIITDQLRGLTPSYPVTIDAPAFAKSVTMNDFGKSAPQLINKSSLTISGVLSLAADSIVNNDKLGTISVGGLMEVLNTSVLQNSGLITLAQGGDFKDNGTISNTITGTIDVSGGTLNVQVDIANSGKLTVESNAKLTLGSAAIDGGTVTNHGEIDLAGSAVLKNGLLGNFGQIKVSGADNALDKETVTANHALEILAGGALLLELGTTVANAGGNVTVDPNATLTLDTASIDGGTVTDKASGIIDLTGAAVLKSGVLGNAGQINVSGIDNALDAEIVTNTDTGLIDVTGVLTLDLGTSIAGAILTNSGTVKIETAAGATLDGVNVQNGSGIIQVDDATLSFAGTLVVDDGTTITGGTLTIGSLGLVEVETSLGATLDGVKVGNSGVVQVDAGSVLNLKGTTITDGTVTGDGTIHITGDSAIDGAKLDTSQVTVDVTRTLTLDDTTVTGTAITDSGTVKVEATTTLKLSGVKLTGGAIDNLGTVEITGDSSINGDIFTNTGAALTVDGGQTLILDDTRIIGGTIHDNGTVKIDSGKTLTLDGATVIGGTITDNGTIDVAGNSTIEGGTVLQHGGVTIEIGHTLTLLDQVTVSGSTITGTNVTSIVQTDGGQTVTLNGAAITGGTLDNDGIINSTGISAFTDVIINNTGKIEATSGVLTIDPAAGVTLSNSGTIQANSGELVLSGETVANTATLEALNGGLLVLDHTTVNNAHGLIVVGDSVPSSMSTVDLKNAAITGGEVATHFDGVIDVIGGVNTINATAVDNSGTLEVTGGSLTIDAASTVQNSGLFEANGGDLIVKTELSGNAEIGGASLLELGGAHSSANVAFLTGSTGTLTLDHADSYSGTISGLDDNTLDLGNVGYGANTTASYAGTAAGGILSIFVNGVDVSNIRLSGNYLGVHWILSDDGSTQHGTDITEAPGLVVAGLDSRGDASEGSAVNALITDGGKSVTNATYAWQIFDTAQDKWVVGSGADTASASYVPGKQDEGHALRVSVSFTDATGHIETGTASAGTVSPVADQPVVTASAATVNEDGTSALTLTLINVAGLFENPDDSVTVTVSLDHGATLHGNGVTANDNCTFTLIAHSATDLTGLTITPAGEFEGRVTVGVSAVAHDGLIDSAIGTTSTTLTVSPVADQPVMTASAVTVNEDGTSALTLTLTNAAGLFEDPDDSVTVTVSLDHGATLHGNGVIDNDNGTFTLIAHSATDLSGLTITPAGEFQGTVTVGVSAVAHDGLIDSAIGTASTTLTVSPVADQPVVTASAAAINEDGTSALTLTLTNAAGLFENPDDSVAVTVSLDHGATLHGNGVTANDNGTFTLIAHSATDLTGLTITPAGEFEGRVTVGVSAIAHDGLIDSAIGTTSTTLTVSPVADQPLVTASAAAINEDGTSALTLTNAAGLFENPDDSVTVTVSLDHGATLHGTNVTAVTDNHNGTFTLTAHSATDLSGLTITPASKFEGTVSVGVSAIAQDGAAVSTPGTTSTTLTVKENPAGDLVATLDSIIAKQGVAIHVTGVTDGGNPVSTGLSYAWQDSSDNGQHWTTVGHASGYTPGEADEGKVLQLVMTYTNAAGSESSTYNLGMPNDLTATLDSTTAEQGVTVHVTGAKDGGTSETTGLSYAWQVSSDGGLHWSTVGHASSYTPVQADDGKALQVVVNYTDPGENESVTESVGIVAAAKVWNGGSHDWQTASQWTASGVPVSSDDAVVGASGEYTVKISQDAVARSLIVNDSGATVEIVGGHSLTLGGDLTSSAGSLQIDSGATLKDIAAHATMTGSLIDNGTIEAGGGTLEIATAVNSGEGKFKIDAGATLQLDHADGLDVAFAGAGELILKDPANFHGTISRSGGSLDNGDVVDVAGFDATASVHYSGNKSGGTVTISELHHTTVTLQVGANSTNWSQGVSDGQGGILIHDPPDDSGAATSDSQGEALLSDANTGELPAPLPTTVAATGTDQTMTGTAGSDTFVFNFAGIGHDTVANFDPAVDVLQLSAWAFAKPQAILDVTHDDGHGNTVITPDAHDTITLLGVLKAQLSLTDFHTV
jgi:fibronectin-binding autotransporter adhesin